MSTSGRNDQTEHRPRLWAGWLISLALLAGLSLALTVLGLVLPWRYASGQTVPRTPPPTWTRTPRPVTPDAQSSATPTDTLPPTWTPTPVPGAPTPIPQANLALTLSAAPELVGPGDVVRFVCRVANRGDAAAAGVEVVLEIPWPLGASSVVASQGTASRQEHRAVLSLASLGPGEVMEWAVEAAVQPAARPGASLACQATLSYRGGSTASNVVTITLPPALLPSAGG